MRWARRLGLDALRDLQFLQIPTDCYMEKGVEAGRPVRKLLYHPWRESGGREMAWDGKRGTSPRDIQDVKWTRLED